MGKRSLPILIAAACALSAVPDAHALTLDEAARRVRAEQAGQQPLAPLYTPDVRSTDTGLNLRSPWQAVGLSLLLPGAGQIYGGAAGRGKVFLGAEALVWGMALGFDRWSAWKKGDATDFAVEHAELIPAGKDDTFLEYLEFYDSRDEFNRAGRIIDPSRPFLPETRDTYWQWDSGDSRRIYRDLRNQSDAAGRNATFMVYVAVINRVVSAVDAFRVVHKSNARQQSERGLKLSWKPALSLSNPGLKLNARFVF
jgi:TM2 domain-containing membrane protein YozV